MSRQPSAILSMAQIAEKKTQDKAALVAAKGMLKAAQAAEKEASKAFKEMKKFHEAAAKDLMKKHMGEVKIAQKSVDLSRSETAKAQKLVDKLTPETQTVPAI